MYLYSSVVQNLGVKIITPNYDPSLKQTTINSCLNCSASIHESLGSLLNAHLLGAY